MRRPRIPGNALDSQRPVQRVPYMPGMAPDVTNLPATSPGAPPDARSFAVTTFDGRQMLMRDFNYKIALNGFMNAPQNLAFPIVGGAPVVLFPTVFLYPLDAVNNFADIGPNAFADLTPSPTGGIAPVASFPSGFGYEVLDGLAPPLLSINGIAGNQGNSDWTLEAWVFGTNWDALGAVTTGIFAISDAEAFAASANSVVLNTSNVGDAFHFLVRPASGETFQTDVPLIAVNNTPHFFSITRNGTLIFLHVDGVLQGTLDISTAVDPSFNFNAKSFKAMYNGGQATQRLRGAIGDVRFTSGALYSAAGYTVPTSPLTATGGALNNGAFAMQVPEGFRMILRRVVIAGGVAFSDNFGGITVALTSAGGPSDDFYDAIAASPNLTFYRNGEPLPDIAFGNTVGNNNSNNIGELLFGPISVDLYQILNSNDVFAVGVALNPAWVAGKALFTLSEQTYCYLYGQIIPSDSSELTETGLTRRPIPVFDYEGQTL